MPRSSTSTWSARSGSMTDSPAVTSSIRSRAPQRSPRRARVRTRWSVASASAAGVLARARAWYAVWIARGSLLRACALDKASVIRARRCAGGGSSLRPP